MKRLMMILILITMLFSLAACSFAPTEETAITTPQFTQTHIPVPTPLPTPTPDLWPPEIPKNNMLSGCRNFATNLNFLESGEKLYYLSPGMGDKSAVPMGLWIMDRNGSNAQLLTDPDSFYETVQGVDSQYDTVTTHQLLENKNGRVYMTVLALSGLNVFDYDIILISTDLNGQDIRYEDMVPEEEDENGAHHLLEPVSDSIYTYTPDIENKTIYRADGQGNKELLYEGLAYGLNLQDGWLYFLGRDGDDGPFSIYCMNINTDFRQMVLIIEDTKYGFNALNVCGNWIYYIKDFYLYRVSIDGLNNTLLCESPVDTFVVFGDTIIFKACELGEITETGDGGYRVGVDPDPNLRRMDTDGQNEAVIDLHE